MASSKPTEATTPLAQVHRPVSLALAIGCMLLSVLLFSVFNATAKWLVADYSPFQIMFFRGLFGLLPVALLLLHDGGGRTTITSRRLDLQLLRGATALMTNICFIIAYQSMPLADAVAIGYAAPIFVTILSVPMLSERVGVHRWSAVIVGFIGVLLVAQPGVGILDPAALIALAGTISYAVMIIITRALGRIDSTICTMAHSTLIYALACSLALPFVWFTPSWPDLALFLGLGFVSGAGMFFFMQAYRHGEAATIAPFDYTAMGWAILFGLLIWGDIPGSVTVAGIAVIMLSGLYITRREIAQARIKAQAAEIAR